MLEKPCPNHGHCIKHALKDYGLIKKWLLDSLKKEEQKKKPDDKAGGGGEKEDGFLEADGVLMIFGGPTVCESKCKQKVVRCEVFTAEPTALSYLHWSESAITFNRTDHPTGPVPASGRPDH